MDKPADPATPFGEVYQAFLDDLVQPAQLRLAPRGPSIATSLLSARRELLSDAC